MAEKDWYKKIQGFFEKQGFVCHGYNKGKKGIYQIDFVDTGVGNIRIDVFGCKRPSERFSNFQLETIGVEVKDRDYITLKDMRQAASYSNLCTRCYLAAPVKEFSENEKKSAADIGIGLISLKEPFIVVIESRKFNIDIDLLNQFLTYLNVVFCATCRTYKHRYDPEHEKYDGGSWRSDIFSKKSKWTYICEECSTKFAKNDKAYLEARNFDWIDQEIEQLRRRNERRKEDVGCLWEEFTYLKEKIKKNRDVDWKWFEQEINKLKQKIKNIQRQL